MARLQILELPEGSGDDRPPFLLVVDQWPDTVSANEPAVLEAWMKMAEQAGARTVLLTEDTIDIPANHTSAYLDAAVSGALPADAHYETTVGGQPVTWTRVDEARARAVAAVQERTDIARDMDRLAKWRDELADALGYDRAGGWDALLAATAAMRAELTRAENARDHLRNDRDEARSWARHGYEIGQKHCSWTDHGVAPDWLTEGWPPHIESCEHLKQAAEYDEALTRVRALALGNQTKGEGGGLVDADTLWPSQVLAAIGPLGSDTERSPEE
ncbi:hypothetical protein OOK29_09850 [Streptomyces phaeochromogenes]|uniref:hypothetical protein n=1 Tax=Streptomyces phaeochromogenes TaxID=1923 RepID=UPI002255F398|nr:hypothetical protein [Streptomyces phaeochromogenes]MCX5598441.1 hypothetical protein [Streptomyces phaeochromogenes]